MMAMTFLTNLPTVFKEVTLDSRGFEFYRSTSTMSWSAPTREDLP